jgi:ABC-2 type transport system ATP-binding protein
VAIIHDGTVVRTGEVRALITAASNEIDWRVQPVEVALPVLQSHAQHGTVRQTGDGRLRCAMNDIDVGQANKELTLMGCTVFEISQHKATLEDVFLQTTGGETADDFSLSGGQ